MEGLTKNIKGSKHIPIGQFSSQIEKMSPDKKYILITQNRTLKSNSRSS